MAIRKPLVFNAGAIQQLQAGDTLQIPIQGAELYSLTNDEASPIVIGTLVYVDANDGVKKAKADASGTKDLIGIVFDISITNAVAGNIQTGGVFVATTGQIDTIFGTTGGFTRGTRYFLSAATSGNGTVTAPSTTGQYAVEVGIAISTTELLLSTPFRNILL